MMTQEKPYPRFSHLHEVLDGAASLQRVIREAEEALLQPGLIESDRSLLESALTITRERLARVHAMLSRSDAIPVQMPEGEWTEDAPGLPVVAGAAATAVGFGGRGMLDDERAVLQDLARLGRSLQLGDLSSVAQRLSDQRPSVRAAALRVLVLHWRLPDYADQAIWMLASDEESDCRRAAALSLGSLFAGSRDARVGSELAAALTRLNEEDEVQWACWYALHELDGGDTGERPLPDARFKMPEREAGDLLSRYRRD